MTGQRLLLILGGVGITLTLLGLVVSYFVDHWAIRAIAIIGLLMWWTTGRAIRDLKMDD